MTISESETADRLSVRRARLLPVFAIALVAQQSAFFAVSQVDGPLRTVDYVQAFAWMFLSGVLLLVVATGGFWLRPARVRALLEDENTRANRLQGMRVGFIAAMLAAILLYVIALFEPVAGREAIHIIVTAGLAAALLRFGYLERRAMQNG